MKLHPTSPRAATIVRAVSRAATLRVAVLASLFLCSAIGSASAARVAREEIREIKPPFGLSWGETAERLERMLKAAKAVIVDRRFQETDREAWDVEGLVQTGLKRTVFYFRRGELVEVELQYQKEDWNQTKYDEFMGQVRRRIEQRYGAGQQIVRKTEPEGEVTQTVVGYKWNVNNTAIELYYFSAEDARNVFRTLSVHYKLY